MNFLVRLAGAYVDAVLNTFYPLEQEPSMADLYANQLADKEAEEEVSTGGRVGPDDLWPETPDPIDHMIALLEDIRNLLSSAAEVEMDGVVAPRYAAAESPDSVETTAESGHPNHNTLAATTIGAAYRSHQASRDKDGDWRCVCGQKFWWESDWREHLGESIADALAQGK